MLVLEALSSLSEIGAARIDIYKKIQQKELKYRETSLKYTLKKLLTPEYGGILRYDSNSGRYSFSDPIFRVYALAEFPRHGVSQGTMEMNLGDLERTFLRLLREKFEANGTNHFRIQLTEPKD